MFIVIAGWGFGNLAFWDGQKLTTNEKVQKVYRTQRCAIKVAKKLKTKHQQMQFEVENKSTGRATRIIVIKDDLTYSALPKDFRRLKAEGFSK